MSVTVIFGKEIKGFEYLSEQGQLCFQLYFVDGDYSFPSAVTVKETIEYTASMKIDSNLWPIYYDVSPREIDIEDAYRKSGLLRLALSSLPIEAINADYFLGMLNGILSTGRRFLISNQF